MLYLNTTTKHEVLTLTAYSGEQLSYCDTRKFGLLKVVKVSDLKIFLKKLNLGLEPLGEKINIDIVRTMLQGSKQNIKDWLLNQSFIAGIGNIYACEILFATKIHPLKKANSCSEMAESILKATIQILSVAIQNGGSTIQSYASPNGSLGNNQKHLNVYGRTGKKCFVCNSLISKITKGRTSFFCNSCQVS